MKKVIFYIMSVSLICLSSCSTKPPTLKNPDNGIVAVPLEIINTSGMEFARYYEIIDERRPEMSIKVYPQSNQTFVFSREVPPGEYYFSKIKHIIRPEYEATTSVYEQSIIVPVEIKPGYITILEEKLVVNQSRSSATTASVSVRCVCDFHELTDSEIGSLVTKFKETIGDTEWKITNEL